MTKNFLNNQNYILWKTEKKKLLSKFFAEKELKNIMLVFKNTIKWANENQLYIFLGLIILLMILFLWTNILLYLFLLMMAWLISSSPIMVLIMLYLWEWVSKALSEKNKLKIDWIKNFFILKNVSKLKMFMFYYFTLISIFMFNIYLFINNNNMIYNYINSLNLSVFIKLMMKMCFPIIIITIYWVLFLSFFKITDFFSKVLNNYLSDKMKKMLFFPFYMNYFSLLILPFLFMYMMFYIFYSLMISYFFIKMKWNIQMSKLSMKSNVLYPFKVFKNNLIWNKYYELKIMNPMFKNTFSKKMKIMKKFLFMLLMFYFTYSLYMAMNTGMKMENWNIPDDFKSMMNPMMKL